jgi:hypothetical protein
MASSLLLILLTIAMKAKYRSIEIKWEGISSSMDSPETAPTSLQKTSEASSGGRGRGWALAAPATPTASEAPTSATSATRTAFLDLGPSRSASPSGSGSEPKIISEKCSERSRDINSGTRELKISEMVCCSMSSPVHNSPPKSRRSVGLEE